MNKKLFGTDGVRGVANQQLTPELALSIGRAAGAYVREQGGGEVLIGWDPRLSSTMLKSGLAAGFCSSGIDVVEAGTIPTGTLALFVRCGGYALGAMVSASHNPASDNGIKLIGPNGRKLADSVEVLVEKLIDAPPSRAAADAVGTITTAEGLKAQHLAFLREKFPIDLSKFRLVVDCAHGAAAGWAGEVFRQAGAEVVEIGVTPNGLNINAEGGATKPSQIQEQVRIHSAHVGIAFDGDADRAVFADEHGNLLNGDAMMAMWATHRAAQKQLQPPVVVGTVMSNMGMERFLATQDIRLERTPVGDRYVVEKMDETGALIGGEQSGHIVFSELAPTGDGIVTAMEMLSVLAETGKPLSEAARLFEPWPQVLLNVRLGDKDAWRTAAVETAIEDATEILGELGRINVRPSGTQPILRIMCEHRDRTVRDAAAEKVFAALRAAAKAEIYSRVELTDALGD